MNILISFAYISEFNRSKHKDYQGMLDRMNKLNILLDSGAFTVFKQGIDININEYCAYVKNPPFKIWRYFTLDKIGDPAVTDRNFQYMLDKGLNPIPVFQRGQPIEKLYELQEKFGLTGIGGVAGTNDRNSYLKWILEDKKVDARKLHLLGVLDLDIIRHYKPYSCDSTLVSNSARFGNILYYDPVKNKIAFSKKDIVKKDYIMRLLPKEIQKALFNDKGWIHKFKEPTFEHCAHIKAAIILADHLNKKLEKVGCKFFMVPHRCFHQLYELIDGGLV